MHRSWVLLALASVIVPGLSGCLAPEGDQPAVGDGEDPVVGGAQGDTVQGGEEGDAEVRTARLVGSVRVMPPGSANASDGPGVPEESEQVGVADASLRLVPRVDEDPGSNPGPGTVLETRANKSAAFVFTHVVPGAYVLEVEAACCIAKNLSVDLQPGQEKSMHVLLDPVEVESAPRIVEAVWEGKLVCGAVQANLCYLLPGSDNLHVFEVEANLSSVVGILEWEGPELVLMVERLAPNETYEYLEKEGSSALVFRVDAGEVGGEHDFENIEAPWELRYRVFPAFLSMVVQVEFTLVYQMFYEERAPKGYEVDTGG